MSSKFGKIKTADELEKAILSVKAHQRALGTGISKDARHLLDSMKPSSIISNFVPATTLTDAGLGLVQGIKKIFTVPDKSAKPAKKLKPKKKADTITETAPEAEETATEAVEEAAAEVAETAETAEAAESGSES